MGEEKVPELSMGKNPTEEKVPGAEKVEETGGTADPGGKGAARGVLARRRRRLRCLGHGVEK